MNFLQSFEKSWFYEYLTCVTDRQPVKMTAGGKFMPDLFKTRIHEKLMTEVPMMEPLPPGNKDAVWTSHYLATLGCGPHPQHFVSRANEA